jgi:orotate phosphoribosyltransferase-like protein
MALPTPSQAHQKQIESLAIRNNEGQIVDYKNPFPEGSDKAKFVDALSVDGKKMLFNNQYAFETFGWAVSAEGLEKALDKVDDIVSLRPPKNTDPYADAKKYYNTEGSFKDFLLGAATLALPTLAPVLGSSIGTALGATGSTAAALGNALVGGTLAEAGGGDFLKGAATSGLQSYLKTDVAPAVSKSVGGGTLGNVASGALTGGVTSALKGGDVLTGAVTGGVSGFIKPLSETDASFMAADAKQLAEQGLSESQISDTLSAGYASTTAADLAASLAVGPTRPSASKIEKELDKLSETVGLTPVETTDPEFVAADALGIAEAASRDNNFAPLDNELLDTTADAEFLAADAKQLADQGLSENQISDTLSSGYADTTGADLAASLATNDLSIEEITNSLLENELLKSNLDIEADAEFLAADAKQLADQGLSKDQISNTLSSGYADTTEADLAASLATNDLSIKEITNSLLNNEAPKGGVDIGAIEQNLTASGVDPLVAADVANEVALNPTISVDDLSKYTKDFYGNTLYDVEDLNFDPTEPPDTRPKGEILVDTTKAAVTNTPTETSIPTLTPTPAATPPSGLFSQPNTSSDPFNFGANIAFGSSYQNPFARDRAERQSLISGLFNL